MDDDLIDEKFRGRDLALQVAVANMEKRLDAMNEFRDALKDQAATFLTRNEHNATHEPLVESTAQLRIDVSRYLTRVEESDKASAFDRAQLDKRLEGMNEFRAHLRDQATAFLTRAEYVLAHAALVDSVAQLRIDMSRYITRLEESDKTAVFERAQLDKRLEGMNEFRLQHKDQVSTFVTRNELDVAVFRLTENDNRLESRATRSEARLSMWDGRFWAVGTLFVILNLAISYYFTTHF